MGKAFILFYPGHPLFQGVSHVLLTCPIVLLPALGSSIVLASSNQHLVIRRRLICEVGTG